MRTGEEAIIKIDLQHLQVKIKLHDKNHKFYIFEFISPNRKEQCQLYDQREFTMSPRGQTSTLVDHITK